MASPIALFDDWTPSMDSLLEWLILDKLNLTTPNPTEEQVQATRAIVDAQMPIAKGSLERDSGTDWYWQVSGPCYRYTIEQQDRFRKRWQPGTDSPEPRWGKRKPKWNTSEGAEKSYDLPMYLRSVDSIIWYAVGDIAGVLALLQGCTGLGKKRSYGNGQVLEWDVSPTAEDWHLYRNGKLMKPIPIDAVPNRGEYPAQTWGWRPPSWAHWNKVVCSMPTKTVRRV